MNWRSRSPWLISVLTLVWATVLGQDDGTGLDRQARELRRLVENAPRLPLEPADLRVAAPQDAWSLGMVSWVSMDGNGLIYLLHRGHQADPIVVVDRHGRVVRSWGKGMYKTPHSIRIDPEGNVWTTDAKTSLVLKFSSDGQKLLEIAIGGQPENCLNDFCGTTDVGFGPNGRVFVCDGYVNARILEYTADGTKVREWGTPGSGSGQFRLPHSIAVSDGTIYVADRENGRIQRFTLEGRYLGAWTDLGKTFALKSSKGAIWIATQFRHAPNGSPGWIMKIDPQSGSILGLVDSVRHHGFDVTAVGEILAAPGKEHVRWFRVSR